MMADLGFKNCAYGVLSDLTHVPPRRTAPAPPLDLDIPAILAMTWVAACRARGSERAGGATLEVQAGRDRAKVCQLREHWGYRPTTRGPYILSRRSRDGGNDKIRSDWGEEVRMGRNKERWISKVTNEGVSKANERARRYIRPPSIVQRYSKSSRNR